MKLLSVSLLLFLVLAFSDAAPISTSKGCAKKCDELRNLLNYKIGKKYVYDFKNKIISDLPKGTTERVRIELSAKAEFHIIGKCEVILTLSGVSMKETLLKDGASPESRSLTELPKQLEKNALPFGFNAGRVTNLCPQPQEERNPLNVKRAIVSQFQISMEHLETPTSLTERDVSGDCLTQYRFKGRKDNNIQIEKTKAILGCANRKMSYSDLQGLSFDRPTESSQMPLLKGKLNCALQVSLQQRHLVSSECKESQVFRPFSGKESGATISVSQSLSLNTISESTMKKPQISADSMSDLLLEHSPDGYRDFRAEDDKQTAEDVLKQICADVQKDALSASKVIAQSFPKFVRYLRDLDGKGLKALQGKLGSSMCKKVKKTAQGVFQDAIPMIRTPESIVFMLEELSSGKSADYRKSWLFSLATVREPTLEMIRKLNGIGGKLNSPLVASSLVATYCKANEMCAEDKEVLGIVKRISSDLGSDCSGNKDKVLLALRAIGNLGMASDWKVITKCIRNTKIAMSVRVSAVQAMRKVRCENLGWDEVDLMNVFKNTDEDPELRINAYLSLITCSARPGILEGIISQLRDENCQQTGSFVWTHLSNIVETSQVFRQALRESLRKIKFNPSLYAKKFNLDYRKFSRNYEKSYFYEPLNSGLAGEVNVIFSTDSFVPRAMSVNFTAGLFGKSISLIEFGARGNNVDQLFRAAYQSTTQKKGDGSKMIHFSMDQYRQNTFGKKMGKPTADLYVRMFGNEFAFMNDISLDTFLSRPRAMEQASRLGQALNNKKFENTRMMMEAVVSVPTLSGFPIELSLDLASSVRMSAGMQLSAKDGEKSIMASYDPSGAVGVIGRMRLNAQDTEIGIEFHGTMYRNFKMGGKLTFNQNEVTLLMDAPQEKATLVDMSSQMFLIHKRSPRLQAMKAKRNKFNLCNTKRSQKVLGLQFCLDANYANNSEVADGPSFPFTGDNQLTVAIKPLAKVAQFKLRGKYIPTTDTLMGIRSLEMEMNAVGSKEDRQLLFAFNDQSKGMNVDMSLKMFSPIKKLEIAAKGDLSKREMDASLKVDKKTLLQLTTKQKIEGSRSVTTITLDADKKPKLIEATFSSDTALKMNELDHILEFKSQKFIITYFKVTAFKKFADDMSISSKYSFDINGAERSMQGRFALNLKEDASDGNMALTVKKAAEVQFDWKTDFSMKTKTEKLVNNKKNMVTEYTIDYTNTFGFDKLAMLNVKKGVLVIQHDFSPNMPDANRFLHFNLKADDLEHATTFQLSQTQNPFALILVTYLRSQRLGLNLDNKLNVAVSGWRAVRIDNTFKRGQKQYVLLIENTISSEKVIQEAKIVFPKRTYHLQSSFMAEGETAYQHTARVAWGPKKSYDLKSTVDWGTPIDFQTCQLFYQINSTALQDGLRLGNFYINSCPNLKDKALSMEIQVSGKEKVIGSFRSDVVFKTIPTDFHIGGSAKTDIPGVMNFVFRTNHIYADVRKQAKAEVVSHVLAQYKWKGSKEFQTYGYELSGTGTEQGGDGKITLHYVYAPIGQFKSTYEGKVAIKKWTLDNYEVETQLKMRSSLIGSAALTMTTLVKDKGESISVTSDSAFEGQISLISAYKFKGTQKVSLKYTLGEKLKADEKFEMTVTDQDARKSRKYEYNYSFDMNNMDNPLRTGMKLDFNSNFALKKLTYKSKQKFLTNNEGGFKYEMKEVMTWTYAERSGSYNWEIQAESKEDSFVATSQMSSPYKQLKELMFGVKFIQNPRESSLKINGKYNDRQADLTIGTKYAEKPASNLGMDPDFQFIIALKGDIPYARDAKLTIKTYYQEFKFIQFDTSIIHMGPQKSKIYFNGGFSESDMVAKVNLGFVTPFGTPELKMKIEVQGRGDSKLEPIGSISQRFILISRAEASFSFGKSVDIKFLLNQESKGKGTQFTSEAGIQIGGKNYIPKGTKLILSFEGNDLIANKGKLFFVKNSNAPFETFEQTFEYDFSEALAFQTQTRYASRKMFSIALEWPEGSDKKKSVELYFKPSGKKGSFMLDYKTRFTAEALDFDSSLLLRAPVLIDEVDLKVTLFQSLKGETKKTDLFDNAVDAFSVSLTTSMKELAKFQLRAAVSADKKVQLALNVVSKKNLDLKIIADLSNLAKITGSVEINGEKIEISLKRKGDDTTLIVKGNGKKIGEAKVTYKDGQSLNANLDATSPTGMKMVLMIKQNHPKGNWNWRQWSHQSSVDISQGGKVIFKGSQMFSFEFKTAKKESRLSANFETSIPALKVFKTTSMVGWRDGLGTQLDVEFKGVGGSRLTIKHKVDNWRKFYLSMLNKVDFTSATSNFRFILNSETNPNMLATFEIAGDMIPFISLIHLSCNENYVVKFASKSTLGNINFETNILTVQIAKELYIRGEVLDYGKVALEFGYLGNDQFKLKLKFGKQFIALYPTLIFKSRTLPFDASLNVKIETSYEQMLSGNIEILQKVGQDYLSAEHKTTIVKNGAPYATISVSYDVLQEEKTGKLNIERDGNVFLAEIGYTPITSVYKHKIKVMRKMLGKRPLFESVADCAPYDFRADVAKCYLSCLYGRTKMVFEVANDVKGSKMTKAVKLAWNDLKKQFVRVLYEQIPKEQSEQTSLTFQSPIRSYRIERTQELTADLLANVKLSTLTPDLKKVSGYVNIFLQNKPKKGEDYEYTVRVQSSLLKKEVKTVVNYAIDKDEKITIKADMFIGKVTPSLSMTFTMAGFPEKRELELQLTGGDRYLNMFLNYDVTSPVKRLKVGARAKDWKRELDVLYERYRRLETVVDTGKNKQTVKFITEPIQQNSGYRYTLVVDYPEVKGFLKTMLQVNRSPPSLLIIVQRDKAKPQNQLVIYGRFMNSRNILMEIKRIMGSNQITDAYTQVTLSADKIIQTDLKWRPAVFSDAKNFLFNELAPTKMNQYLRNRGEGLLEVLQRVANAVAAPIKANIKISEVLDAAQAGVNDFLKVKDGLVSALKKFKIIFSGLRLSRLLDAITQVSEQINTYVGILFEGISKSKGLPINLDFQKTYKAVQMQYQQIYERLKEYTKDWNDAIFINFLSNAKEVITRAMKGFNAWLDQATQMAKKWAEKRDKFFEAMRKRLGANMSNASNLFKQIQAWMKKVQGTITGALVEKLFNREDLQEWTEMTEKLRILNNWIKSSLQGKKKYSDLQISMQFLANGDLKKAFMTYFKPEKNKVLTWSLKEGYASWQIYFPYDIQSLQTVPAAILSYTQSKLRSTVKEIRQGSFALGKYYLRLNELLFRFSLKEALRRQLPPFKASAWISGSQHFVTFDGQSVEHSGACTYLLAHDFGYHSFSVLGEYKKMGSMVMRKNLIIQTNQAAVYISPKGEVKMKTSQGGESQPKRAPFKAGDLFVSRWGSVLTVKGPNDLSVRCFLDLDVCRLTVSQWSHGHINGFLGSNDYEKCNDVYQAYKKSDFQSNAHADMWKVGTCEVKNYAVMHDTYSRDSQAYRSCSLFDRAGSVFSRCFSKVDPASYLKSCMNMHQMSKKMGSVRVCSIFLMYVSRCRTEGIILQMPRNCMTCGKPSRKDWMKYRRPFTIRQKLKKNFIFIVEAKPCIKQISTVFGELVGKILSRKEDDTYNLITFGGAGNFRNPTLLMLGSAITRGNKADLTTALSQVQLNGKDGVDDGEIATKAVQMALGQNDDVTSATVIVLISCSKCKESARYQYTNMQRRFSKRGIRFHYFLPHDFGSAGSLKVAGFETPNAFNEKGVRIETTRIQQPRDTCSALARSTGGSSWDINTLLKMKGAARGSMLKNTLKKPHQNRRTCSCTGSVNNDDVIQCNDRK